MLIRNSSQALKLNYLKTKEMVHDDFKDQEDTYQQQIDEITVKKFSLAMKQINDYINSRNTYKQQYINYN